MSDQNIQPLISHIEIENFKAVEKASIDLTSLTAVVGVNSSGKSTFIQAILLLVQHIRDEYSSDLQYSLNEDLVQLGIFNETVLHTATKVAESFRIELTTNSRLMRRRNIGGPSRQIRWNVVLAPDETPYSRFARLKSLSIVESRAVALSDKKDEDQFEFFVESIADNSDSAYEELERIPVDGDRSMLRIVMGRRTIFGSATAVRYAMFESARTPVQFQKTVVSEHVGQLGAHWYSIAEQMPIELKERLRKGQSQKIGALSAQLVGSATDAERSKLVSEFAESIQNAISVTCSEIEGWAELVDIDDLGLQRNPTSNMDERCSRAVIKLRGAIFRVIDGFEETFHRMSVTPEEIALWISTAAKSVFAGSGFLLLASHLDEDEQPRTPGFQPRESLKEVFSQVYYLGPIRDIDREYSGTFIRHSLGLHGEHSATVLQRESREKITNSPIPPGEIDLDQSSKFGEILNAWMKYLDLADAIQVEDRGRYKAGIKIVPRRGGTQTISVNSVGVGVAQVLPVVMQCLLAEPGASITVIEQPELHLHPSIEVKLAEFFIACARTGRQIFIETHSEHLINRLRLEIARDDSGSTRNLVSVLFANQDESTGITSYERALINEVGGIEGGWPDNFLDLSTDQSLNLLEVAIRRRQSELFQDSDDEDDF